MELTLGNHALISMMAAAAASAALPAPALAQSVAPTSGANGQLAERPLSPEANNQVDDIVVTAQRRAERLQNVPISAQVVSGAELQARNLNGVVSLAEETPAIQILPQGRSSRIYVRGIGSGEAQSFDQSVSTFIDDVYHGRSRLTSATFLDLERVEILKGPQTTFFGNNAIAGAINIVTRKPGKAFEADVRGLLSPTSGENGGQYVAEAAVTAPLSDALRVRIAATANGQQGFVRNVVTGKRAPKEDNLAGRITALYEPNAVFDLTAKAEVSHNRSEPGLIGRRVDCPSPFAGVVPNANGLLCATSLAQNLPIGLKTDKIAISPGGLRQLDTQDGALSMNYRAGDVTLSSVTGYHAYQFKFNLDNDLTAQDLLNVQAPEHYRQFSQELRIASATDRTVEFLAGLYYQKSTLDIEQSVSFLFFPAIGVPLPNFGQRINSQVKEDVYSAFGSVTLNASDKLKFNAGLRGSIVRKGFTWALRYGTTTAQYGGIVDNPIYGPGANPANLGVVGNVALRRQDDALMPSARVQYAFDRDVMAYASFTRGFKSGGFSVADVSANPANYGFNPEHVNAYEIGVKSELFGRKVRLNLAAFRNDFTDLQVALAINTGGSFQSFIRNAARARTQGVEAEVQWVVAPIFRISAEGTYLDAKYLEYPGGETTLDQKLAGLPVQDLAGHRTLFAPRWSGNLTGTLTLPVSDGVQLVTEGTAIFSTSYQTYPSDDFRTLQPGYTRLDARIGIESRDGRWGVDVIGKNLNNRIIRTVSAYEPLAFGPLIQERKQLRNIALQVRYRFR